MYILNNTEHSRNFIKVKAFSTSRKTELKYTVNPKEHSYFSDMSCKNEVQISKALSAVLRHNKMGFKVDSSMFFIYF